MRVVFFGNPEFASSSLTYLNDINDISIELVVTNPDKKSGRGLKKKMTPVKEKALSLSYKILECDNLKRDDFYQSLLKVNADLFIVVAYRFLPKKIFTLPKIGTINLHASLLPKYKGASPIQYALINGDNKTGLTTFYINEFIDCGKIIKQEEVEIDDRIDFVSLYKKLSILSEKILYDTIKIIKNNLPVKQILNQLDNEIFAPKISKKDFLINWDDKSFNIHNKIRALSYSGAYTLIKGKRVKFFDTYYNCNKTNNEKNGSFFLKDNLLHVKCSDGYLVSKFIQVQGAKKIKANDFLNSNLKSNYFE